MADHIPDEAVPEPSEDELEALANLLTWLPSGVVVEGQEVPILSGLPEWSPPIPEYLAEAILAAGFTRRPMPSREQIAEAIARGLDGWNDFDDASADYQNELLSGADAVLALFATPGGDS